MTSTMVDALDVLKCNFTNIGGTLGAAFLIEKISSDSVSLVIRIEDCNFIGNIANAGSAVYVIDSRFGASTSTGRLTVHLININAENNVSPSATLQYDSSDYVTGVLSAENSHIILNCSHHCNFLNNQPTVFFGRFSSLTISGNTTFMHNSGFYGGVFHLSNTVTYIYKNAQILFAHNYARFYGGAISVFFTATNIQSQDICPIQFIGTGDMNPIFSLDDLNLLNINVTFENNTAGTPSSLQSIFATVFYICSWCPDTITQYNFDLNAPPINGTRSTVYHELFNFVPRIQQMIMLL